MAKLIGFSKTFVDVAMYGEGNIPWRLISFYFHSKRHKSWTILKHTNSISNFHGCALRTSMNYYRKASREAVFNIH